LPIYRLLQRSAFSPEDIASLVSAYEDCLRILKLSESSDTVKEVVARHVIEIAQTGVRGAAQIRELALKQIKVPPLS
jgi:hypothetical protein